MISKSGYEAVSILKRLAKEAQTTILLVTHDYRILDMADRVVELEDGVIKNVRLDADELLGGEKRSWEMWFPALPDLENQADCNEISSRTKVFKSPEYLEAHVLKSYLCYLQWHAWFYPIWNGNVYPSEISDFGAFLSRLKLGSGSNQFG